MTATLDVNIHTIALNANFISFALNSQGNCNIGSKFMIKDNLISL